MRSDYQGLAREFKDKAGHQLQMVKGRVVESSKDVAKKVDQQARRKPWHFVGIAALFSAVFGFFLGRKTKD